MPAGYSKTPLVKKLGIKLGFKIHFANPPDNLQSLLGELPEKTTTIVELNGPVDYIHFFTKSKDELQTQFPILKAALAQNGLLWISWPKKASKVTTDLNENIVRGVGLQNGLVDVKVCAVDEIWSGLKFVYRLKDRK
ncbi:DUF3052 domain-containing protein [candidate division KSB1 bacterium]|nr:DUF3052 domain-containing protein [candidate division KSB1 bacterium]